jgi:hypothetical protein
MAQKLVVGKRISVGCTGEFWGARIYLTTPLLTRALSASEERFTRDV